MTVQMKCVCCGKEFSAKRKTRKYCSNHCRYLTFIGQARQAGQNRTEAIIKRIVSARQSAGMEREALKAYIAEILKELFEEKPLTLSFAGMEILLKPEKIIPPQDESYLPSITDSEKGNSALQDVSPGTSLLENTDDTKAEKRAIIEQDEVSNSLVNEKQTPAEHHPEENGEPQIEQHTVAHAKPDTGQTVTVNQVQPEDPELLELLNKARKDTPSITAFSWEPRELPHIIEVSTKFLTLLKYTHQLSLLQNISESDLKEVANACHKLIRSSAFRNLPMRYPYRINIEIFADLLQNLAARNKYKGTQALQLSPENKAKIISLIMALKDQFPSVDFKDTQFD